MTEREKRIKKIKALLAMTVENGASENEMMQALAAARRIMDAEGITDEDVAFGGESVVQEAVVKTDFDKIRDHLATPVGFFCGCQTWKRGSSDVLVFCGLQSEAIFAHWLLDMLADFVLRETETYAYKNGARTRRGPRLSRLERASFIHGCVSRIAQRLRELTPAPVPGSGRDLVVAKNALIENYMREQGIKLREPFKLYRMDEHAYAAGHAAGDRAQFVRPVEGMNDRKFIS